MIYVRLIDEDGMFISDEFVEELTEFTVETPCPSGFYHPRWNGTEWVEGLTVEEIQVIKDNVVVEVTLSERVTNTEIDVTTLEETINTIFGGI